MTLKYFWCWLRGHRPRHLLGGGIVAFDGIVECEKCGWRYEGWENEWAVQYRRVR